MAVEKTRVPLLHEDRPALAHHGEKKGGGQVSGLELGGGQVSGLELDGGQVSGLELGGGAAVVTSLLAGAAAGALAKSTIAPLDRCKINFQVSSTPYSWRAALAFLAASVRREGWAALWRGNSATMARIVPYAAVQFAAHEHWRKVLRVDTPQTAQASPLKLLLSGSLAGVTSQSATYPLDMARARMAVADYRSLRAVFGRVVREEGLLTLYRGYPATVMGVIPYAGVSFFTYDSLKLWYRDHTGQAPSGMTKMAFGGAAGALAQTASYPLDIVRRRMQTARRRADRSYPYPTIAATLATVYRSEGWLGFFKGLSMNWVKGPIAVGISFTTYDYIKSALTSAALRVAA